MKVSMAARVLVASAAVCAAAGCAGGSQIAATPAAPLSTVQGHSWMAREATSTDLLYVSDEDTNEVHVYSYPSLKPEGTLTGFNAPFGECTDKHGNVFIANDDASQILEYAHGGTQPIATLDDPGYYPRGCSIDPTTGNLAVANIVNVSLGQGNVAIYKGAKGSPATYYSDANVYNVYSVAYDSAGNLYIDGENDGSSSFAFAELAKGRGAFTDVALDQPIRYAGGVQWDGKYIAVGDQFADIYRFSIAGDYGAKVGTTRLKGIGRDSEFWIQGSNVVVPDSGKRHVGVWDYPGGGSVEQRASGLQYPVGATVSVAEPMP